jgi:sugar O-acyltransferase (sialic acid O-acetyltransferase NeuD family)
MGDLLIYGSSGFGREVAWQVTKPSYSTVDTVLRAFINDIPDAQGIPVHGFPVLSLEDAYRQFPGALCVVAVGEPALRETLVQRATTAGLSFDTLICDTVMRSPSVTVGEGSIICAGCILTVDITIGRHAHINLDCTVGHDAVLEDYVTLAPGVHVSGWVRIERGAYIGTGANIINGNADKPLIIGAGAVIGAGATVIRDIPAGVTAVGLPAKPKT